jgi:hypothetical protein
MLNMNKTRQLQTMLVMCAVLAGCTDEAQELQSKIEPPGSVQKAALVVEAKKIETPKPLTAAVVETEPEPAPMPEAVVELEKKGNEFVPPTAAAGTLSGVEIKRVVFTKDVVGREPVDTATSFSQAVTPKVWMFIELANGNAEPLLLDVSWENPEGKASRPVQLSVPNAKRWRTQSFTSTDKKPGTYRCVVKAADGTVLVDQKIEITA